MTIMIRKLGIYLITAILMIGIASAAEYNLSVEGQLVNEGGNVLPGIHNLTLVLENSSNDIVDVVQN